MLTRTTSDSRRQTLVRSLLIPLTPAILAAASAIPLAGCGADAPFDDGAPPSQVTSRQSALSLAAGALSTATAPATAPVGLTPAPPVAPSYGFMILPFTPAGINDSGVVGGQWNGNIVSWSNGATTFFPVPDDDLLMPATGGAINNAGSIIGQVNNHGYVWIRPLPPGCTQQDCMLPIEIRAPNHTTVTPTAINNANVVVGTFVVPSVPPFLPEPQLHAFRWSPTGGFQDLTPTGWLSAAALDVNDSGETVGYGLLAEGRTPVALRWSSVAGRPPRVILSAGEADAIGNNGTSAGVTPGLAPTLWSTPTTATPSFRTSAVPAGPTPTHLGGMADTGRVVGDGLLGTEHPFKPWTTFRGTVEWLAVPADGPNTISDVFSDLRVNTCGSIVGSEALTFRAGNNTVIEFQGFLWTKPSCDPPPPAVTSLPTSGVSVSTTIGIQ